jgi:hypothetical protein
MSYGTPDVCLRSGAAAIPAPDTSSPVIASGEVRTNVGGSRMRGVTGPGVLRIQLAQCEVRLFLRIHYHQASDLYSTYSDKDFRLGPECRADNTGRSCRADGCTLACAQPIGNFTVGLHLGSVATKPLSGVGGKFGRMKIQFTPTSNACP